MKRRTLDLFFSVGGALTAILLLVAGGAPCPRI